MLKNCWKTACRYLLRHKSHTIINVAGLALGMGCCLLIFLWVSDERSVDRFHVNGKRLYSLYETMTVNGVTTTGYNSPVDFTAGQTRRMFPLEDMDSVVPGVRAVVSYATGYELPWGHAETFQVGDKVLKEEGSRAGKEFFQLFSYPLVTGSPMTAFPRIHDISISRKMAEQFFGSPAAAMGKTLRYEDKRDYVVTSVFENLPVNASHHFEFLLNWEGQKGELEWSSSVFQTYFLLSKDADPVVVATKMNEVLHTRIAQSKYVTAQVGLQLFGDQYLYDQFEKGRPAGGRIEYVRLFSGIALFILIIACINFTNLSTARSVQRAKEIGLRKVVGSSRLGLIGQFLAEALVLSFSSLLLSVVLVSLFLPGFNQFTGKHILLPIGDASSWCWLLGLALVTGLMAGCYPALYLSSLKPVKILKGGGGSSERAGWFRKGLTVFQFMLSILLIIATLVVTRQTHYVQYARLGYDRENVLYVRVEGELSKGKVYQSFKERAERLPGIALVDRSSETPHAMNFVVSDAVHWEGEPKDAKVGFKPYSVGLDFLRLMHMQVADGRGFDRAHGTDSSDGFMINEEAVREMGIKQPIGKWISAWNKKGHIIGILKDYHTHSLHEPIKPVIMDVKEYEYFGVILVKTHPGQTREALASLGTLYKDVNPRFAFAYQFMDDEYGRLYANEQVITRLTVLFAALAILISCLGLLGLVMFAAAQRTREIGIRKVLGASVAQIVALFSSDFMRLVVLAFLIALPLGWYFMHAWLAGFAYRVELSWWIFALAGGIAVVVAWMTMGYQAIKAGLMNPVKSLRNE